MNLIITTLILASAGAWAKGFEDNCENIALGNQVPSLKPGLGKNNFYLEGDCGPDRKPSMLYLDMCIGNKDGKLVWRQRGYMSKTCSSCGMSGDDGRLSLQCTCKNIEGDIPDEEDWGKATSIYLDEVIVWEDGGFNCLFR